MHRVMLAVAVAVATAGCLEGSPADAGQAMDEDGAAASYTQPHVVASQEFFAATAGGAGSVPVHLAHDVSDLVLAIDFGSSAYWDFWFSGIPACLGKGPGVGAHPNSAQWTQGCGAVAAGSYHLAWEFIGAAQGTVTVTAIP